MAFDPDAYLAEKKQEPAFDPDAYLAEKKPAGQPEVQAAEKPSVWERLKGVASTIGSGAKEFGTGVAEGTKNLVTTTGRAARGALSLVGPFDESGSLHVPFSQLSNPAYRHEVERGVSDVVTGGRAEKLANMVSPQFAATASPDAAAFPDARAMGQVGGSFLPSPGKYAGEQAALATGKLLGRAPAVAAPIVAGLKAATGAGAQTGVTDLVGGVPLREIPADIGRNAMVSGALGTATGLGTAGAQNLIGKARQRATRDIANDIVAAEGKRARVTDQKRIAEVNDRLYDLTRENPELRQVWREPAAKALPQIAEVKARVAEPLDILYQAVDRQTGGIRLGDILDGFEAEAKQAGKTASGQSDAMRLRGVRENFIKAYGDDPDVRIPTQQFRQEVTSLHKNAESAMGGLEGTARHEALSKLYDAGKQIIDRHLDQSGLTDTNLALLRKTNNDYFLLSRAESAIESRGWKEANKPTGLHLPHGPMAALNMGVLPAVAYGIMHPHALPIIAGTYALGHAAPAITSRANWALAGLNPAAGANLAARIKPEAIAPLVSATGNREYDLAKSLNQP